MGISGSSIAKAITGSAIPIIATGSKISKMIIDKSFGSTEFKVNSNGITIETNTKLNDDNLKEQLLEMKVKNNLEQKTSSLINYEKDNSIPITN